MEKKKAFSNPGTKVIVVLLPSHCGGSNQNWLATLALALATLATLAHTLPSLATLCQTSSYFALLCPRSEWRQLEYATKPESEPEYAQ